MFLQLQYPSAAGLLALVANVAVSVEQELSFPNSKSPGVDARALIPNPRVRLLPGGRTQFSRELADRWADTPEWKLSESAHYAFVVVGEDQEFAVRLRERAEAARELVRQHFPHPELDPVTNDRALDVVLCARNAAQYHSYGGASGGSGFFNPFAHELVLHRDPATRDAITWHTLQGLVFYAYAHELHGEARLPSWFAAGHAEYFRGFVRTVEDKRKDRELPTPAPERAALAEWMRLHAAQSVPKLEEVLAWNAPDRERWRELGSAAWALVWHLRSLERDSPEHPHSKLLARWYTEWLVDGDAARATSAAFREVDRIQLALELRERITLLR